MILYWNLQKEKLSYWIQIHWIFRHIHQCIETSSFALSQSRKSQNFPDMAFLDRYRSPLIAFSQLTLHYHRRAFLPHMAVKCAIKKFISKISLEFYLESLAFASYGFGLTFITWSIAWIISDCKVWVSTNMDATKNIPYSNMFELLNFVADSR